MPATHQELRIADGAGWTFIGGRWTESAEGVLLPPPSSRQYGPQNFQAFREDLVAGDFEARVEWRINGLPSFAEPRLLFRAQDPARCYAVGMPSVGQSWRAKSVWAAIWRVEPSGLHRLLAMHQVLGVVAEHGRWYRVHLRCVGSEIQFSLDGRPLPPVVDGTWRAGRIGLGAWGPAEFRHLQVRAAPLAEAGPPWQRDRVAPPTFFLPCPDVAPSASQRGGQLLRLPSGDLRLWFEQEGHRVVQCSTDAGRTWSAAEPIRMVGDTGSATRTTSPGGVPFLHADGTIRALLKSPADPRGFGLCISHDSGRTWAGPTPVVVLGDWPALPDRWHPYSLCVAADGSVVMFLYTEPLPGTGHFTGMTWGGVWSQAYSMRSTDGGLTWSAPASLDGMWWPGRKEPIEPNMDLTEPAACVAPDGRLCCMIRPSYSPVMWQTWSHDHGRSWEPTAFGPFPGYQVAATSTASGAMLFAMRFPCTTVYVSHDGGVTWRGTMVDYAAQGPNPGGLLEVEPDVVLLTGNLVLDPSRVRMYRLRVTADGVQPA